MENGRPASPNWVLLTGGTGFVGQCLLGELLDRGYRVLCVLRAATPAEARTRLALALKPWGRRADDYLEAGRLGVLRGDLHSPHLGLAATVVQRLRGSLASVVHAAGDTTFRTRPDGEPERTNVRGTRAVFRLARACACRDWHLISTAYVCGKRARAEERALALAPESHNDYEKTKWRAEQESRRAAAEAGATLTVYRPSVVVGHSATGLATRFVGVYYLFRATSLLARAVEQQQDVARHEIPLRIPADPEARPNLVFVDDVARDFADLFACAAARGGTYHLTHPDPPTNRRIKQALERYYDVAGGRFVGRGTGLPANGRTSYEELFAGMTDAISEYLFDSPVFDRSSADRFVTRPAAPWTDARLRRLIDYAESTGWRQSRREADPHTELDGFAAYFQQFLPKHVRESQVGRLRQLDLAVRFLIDGADGDWWCRFQGGRVAAVQRTGGRRAEVTYRTTPAAFWRAVGGDVSGAELFLSGDATIAGNIERGLKFAMILQEFVREFPCDREKLLSDATRAG